MSKPANDYFPRYDGPFKRPEGYNFPFQRPTDSFVNAFDSAFNKRPNTVVCIVCQQNVGTDKFDIEVHRKAHLDRENTVDTRGLDRAKRAIEDDVDEARDQIAVAEACLARLKDVLSNIVDATKDA